MEKLVFHNSICKTWEGIRLSKNPEDLTRKGFLLYKYTRANFQRAMSIDDFADAVSGIGFLGKFRKTSVAGIYLPTNHGATAEIYFPENCRAGALEGVGRILFNRDIQIPNLELTGMWEIYFNNNSPKYVFRIPIRASAREIADSLIKTTKRKITGIEYYAKLFR